MLKLYKAIWNNFKLLWKRGILLVKIDQTERRVVQRRDKGMIMKTDFDATFSDINTLQSICNKFLEKGNKEN